MVYGAGKTPQQVVGILGRLHDRHPDRAVLATRLSPDAQDAVRHGLPDAVVDEVAGAAVLGPMPEPRGLVTVVAAGTSDAPVAAEAMLTARVHGARVHAIGDVGVAGLHRLLDVRDELAEADCLIVVAGMEGALPERGRRAHRRPARGGADVSVGYGASFGGLAALLAMLNSCAPGVTVVNIDNGYGAGRASPPGWPATPGPAPHEWPMNATVGWLDASSGASGDMLLGALVGAGVPLGAIRTAVDAVAPEPVALHVTGASPATGSRRPGSRSTVADSRTHRTWRDVAALLDGGRLLDAGVRTRALATFERLAEAEAAVHGHAGRRRALPRGRRPRRDRRRGRGLRRAGAPRRSTASWSPRSRSAAAASAPSTAALPVPPPAVAELLRGVPSYAGPVDARALHAHRRRPADHPRDRYRRRSRR